MNDYMDSLVKEVEGNIKPIRAEKMDDSSAADQAAEPEKDVRTDDRDLFQHVHRENVKCYRNTQAVIVENSDNIKQSVISGHSSIHGWLLVLFLLTLLNLGATGYLVLHLVFGY